MSKTRYIKIQTENAYEYFSKASGGNNREWVKRYDDMIRFYFALKNQKNNKKFLEGYEACMDIFHARDNILKKEKGDEC